MSHRSESDHIHDENVVQAVMLGQYFEKGLGSGRAAPGFSPFELYSPGPWSDLQGFCGTGHRWLPAKMLLPAELYHNRTGISDSPSRALRIACSPLDDTKNHTRISLPARLTVDNVAPGTSLRGYPD